MAEDAQVNNPYRPVYLPEFDVSVGWAMCRNSMCPDFGIQYDGPAPDGPEEIKDGRYTIDPIEGNFHCEALRPYLHPSPRCKHVGPLAETGSTGNIRPQSAGWRPDCRRRRLGLRSCPQ